MVAAMTMPGTFLMFAALMIVATIFIIFYIPETKGQAIEVTLVKLGAKIENIDSIKDKKVVLEKSV